MLHCEDVSSRKLNDLYESVYYGDPLLSSRPPCFGAVLQMPFDGILPGMDGQRGILIAGAMVC